MGKYEYTPEMGEISGIGGSYEEDCRKLVISGLEFWDQHPELDPHFKGWSGPDGKPLQQDDQDAKVLTEVLIKAVPRLSGAMFGASMNHVLVARKHGWDWYREAMSQPDEEEVGS